MRELWEELGVGVAGTTASHPCRVTGGPADEPATISAWLVREWDGTPTNVAPEEHDDLRWFAIDELPPPGHPGVRAALLDALRG